ncbi:MAG: hypothetical protein ACR2JF_07085 [Iamia sp.]
MAGWGDDPVLAELRTLVYEEGWRPMSVTDSTAGDTVEVEGPDGQRRSFASDHIAFHRFVEGLGEDFDL